MKSIFNSTPRSRRARPQQHEAQSEPQPAFFQPKLTINAPGDKYEQEADAVADKVVSGQDGQTPAVQKQEISAVQRISLATPQEDEKLSTAEGRMEKDKLIQEKPEIQRAAVPKEEEKPVQKMDAPKEEEKPVQKMEAPKEEEKPVQKMTAPKKEEEKPVQKKDTPKEEEKLVQTKSHPSPAQASPNFSSRISARKGQGSALPDNTRTQMEKGIGADFSKVHVHTDSEAAQMNDDIHAQAFTHGQDVYFNSGKYSPESTEGKRLLAHELTHVVQQGGGIQRQPDNDNSGGGFLSGIKNWFGDITNSRNDEARLDAEEDLQDFMAKSFSTLNNHHPSTGRGLFDASYFPGSGILDINLKINFNFQSGNRKDPTWIGKAGGPAAEAAYSPAQFQWTTDEMAAWKSNAIDDIRSAWQDQYLFHTTKLYWEKLPAVHVHINIIDSDAKNAHYVTTINKWPKEPGLRDGVVPPGSKNQSTATFEESAADGITNPDVSTYVTNTGSQPQYQAINAANPRRIQFDQGKSEVASTDKPKLRAFGGLLGSPTMPPFPITVTGRSSSEGSAGFNKKLSFQRALSVSNEIVNGGGPNAKIVAEGENGATAAPEWRRVDISVGTLVTHQKTILHESGHMFGLGDEYPDTGRAVGAPVAHSALAQKLIPGQKAILATDNQNIMSAGEEIRPHHYITFLEALGKITNMPSDWSIGPGPGGHAHEPGDFPTLKTDIQMV